MLLQRGESTPNDMLRMVLTQQLEIYLSIITVKHAIRRILRIAELVKTYQPWRLSFPLDVWKKKHNQNYDHHSNIIMIVLKASSKWERKTSTGETSKGITMNAHFCWGPVHEGYRVVHKEPARLPTKSLINWKMTKECVILSMVDKRMRDDDKSKREDAVLTSSS